MTVQPDELPAGSRLIMGLNPPFGFKASLANQFINKALSFKPKLIVLIVPRETERLDKKYPPYELIWEDSNQLSGKSFYLPGSFDADNKQMEQWNMSPPPLSLWSRSDYAQRHYEIARSKGHLCSKNPCSGDSHRNIADIASVSTTRNLEIGNADINDEEMQGERPATASVIEQLLADTYHDTTSSPGDYWTDTNGRSGQPCNYDIPGRNDPPAHDYVADMATESDMSISSSDRSDCQKESQNVSTSDQGCVGPQDCNHSGSVSAEHPTDTADCDEVTSSPKHAAGVRYQILEDSPLEEDPGDGLWGQQNDLLHSDRHAAGAQFQIIEESCPEATVPHGDLGAEILPPRNTLPGLQFTSAPSWHGCLVPREVLSQGIPTLQQGPSYGWLEK